MITRTLSKVALMLCLASPAYSSEAIFGVWIRGGHEDEKLEFYDCEGQLCAKAAVPPPDGSPAVIILRHAAKAAPNQWKGPIFNPENGKLYSATVTLDKPNEMTLKGCLIAFLCQSETWTRDTTAAAEKAAPPSPDKAGAGSKTPTSPNPKTDASATKTAPTSAKTAPGPGKSATGAAKSAPGTEKKPPAADKKPPDAEPTQ